jgi:hypothetical protein
MPRQKKTENKEKVENVAGNTPPVDLADTFGYSQGNLEIETLLNVRGRKPLPDSTEISKSDRRGPKFKLFEIITHAPDLYAKMIMFIRNGVSFNVACECVGIGESTFYEWGQRGASDFQANADTYFSRFYRDVRRAAALATCQAEMEIKALDPKKWLAHGPGRIFGDAWRKSELPTRQSFDSDDFEPPESEPFKITHKPQDQSPDHPSMKSSSQGKASSTLSMDDELLRKTQEVLDNMKFPDNTQPPYDPSEDDDNSVLEYEYDPNEEDSYLE